MQFLFPGFLWALALLAVPILIHLFYFRRYKQVLFTNVRFLRELVEETATRERLKNLLILLARLLALTAIIFAFSQPFSKKQQVPEGGNLAVSIFVDNSWSMAGQGRDGSLINVAKRLAREIVLAHSDNDRFQIVSQLLEGRHMRTLSKDDALTALEEIEIGPASQSLHYIYDRQVQTIQRVAKSGSIYQISDFQESAADFDQQRIDSMFPLYLVPVQTVEENNLSIDTCYFASPIQIPGQVNALIYKVTNYGKSDAADVRMSYEVNGQQFPANPLSIAAGESIQDTLAVKISSTGWQKLVLKIQDYPIQFDDIYYLCFQVKSMIDLLLIYDRKEPEVCKQLLESIPYFKVELQESRSIKYDNLNEKELVILYQLPSIVSGLAKAIKKATEENTNVLIIPAPNLPQNAYSSLAEHFSIPELVRFETTRQEASTLNTDADVFRDVFANVGANIRLPGSQGQYVIPPQAFGEKIIQYKDGTIQLLRIPTDQNYIFLMACPFDAEFSDYAKNPEISIPLFFKAALSHRHTDAYAYSLANDLVIEWPWKNPTVSELQIKLKGTEEFIPSTRLQGGRLIIEMYDQLKKAGIYDLFNGDQWIGSLAFNDSRAESDMRVIPETALAEKYKEPIHVIKEAQIGDLGSKIKEVRSGAYWWRYLLVFGIMSLFLEAAIIRYWNSH